MLAIRNTDGTYVELKKNSKGNFFTHPVFFSPFCRLTSWQDKPQPTLFMSKEDWEYVSHPKVTHEGAFGEDFREWDEETVAERWVSGYDPRGTAWVIVWKFPGDLNHLTDDNGDHVYKKIYNVPLPVGSYGMYDDEWTKKIIKPQSHHLFPKNVNAEKIRIDFTSGNGVHYLENRENNARVAMIGSHYFIDEFWKVKPQEKKQVVSLIQELDTIGVHAFPCYGQHHAIVFYTRGSTLITPEELVRLLTTNKKFVEIVQSHAKFSINSWVANYIKVVTSNLLEAFKESPKKPPKESNNSNPKTVYAIHKQSDPTGSLVRVNPNPEQKWASNVPIPNNVQVVVEKEIGEFSLVTYKKIKGWVRSKYLDIK